MALPRCILRERGDINECLSSINLSSPVYSDRRALAIEKSGGIGFQTACVAIYRRKMLLRRVLAGNSARVMNHHAALKRNRRRTMAGK